MENKKYLVTAAFLVCVFSSLAMSSTTEYDKEVEIPNGFALEGHHGSRKSAMNLVYTPELLREADIIIGGGENSSPTLESFASSLIEEDLKTQLYTRPIKDEDKRVSYALQLIADNKKDKDEWVSLYKKAWLINPGNYDAAEVIGGSRKHFGEFIDLVIEYQSKTSQ